MAKTKAFDKANFGSGNAGVIKKSLKVKKVVGCDKPNEQHSSEIEKVRKLRRRDSSEMTTRAIALKLGAFSKTQVACNKNADGELAPEVVLREVRRVKALGQNISVQFWTDLIRNHKLSGTLADGLPAPESHQQVAKELDLALRLAHNTNPAKKSALAVIKYLDFVEKLNETEYYGVARGSIECVTMSRSMSGTLQEALVRYSARTRADKAYPSLFEHMKDAFDQNILAQWLRAHARGMTRSQFMRARRCELNLFFDMKSAVTAIAITDEGKDPVESLIDEISKSSVIGHELFKPEIMVMEIVNFKGEITRRLKEVELQHFPEDEMNSFRQICQRLAENLDQQCWNELDCKNQPLSYLSGTICFNVTNSNDLWFNTREARLRTLAVSGNHVKRMPWETWLFGTSPIGGCPETIRVPDELTFDMSNCREFLLSKLDLISPLTVETCRRTIRQNMQELKRLDANGFWMDSAFLNDSYDNLIEAHCKDLVLALVQEGKHMQSIQKAEVAGRLLLSGDVFTAQKMSLQRELKGALNLLTEIYSGRGPTAQEAARMSLWHTIFLKRCENFAMYEEEMAEGKLGRVKMHKWFGSDAIMKRYERAEAQHGCKSPEDLKEFRSFTWLLSKEKQKIASEWQKHAVSTSASRLKETKANMLKDVEESCKNKRKVEKVPAPITAPPLQKKQTPATSSTDTQIVIAENSDCEDPQDAEEDETGLLNFFGARAM